MKVVHPLVSIVDDDESVCESCMRWEKGLSRVSGCSCRRKLRCRHGIKMNGDRWHAYVHRNHHVKAASRHS